MAKRGCKARRQAILSSKTLEGGVKEYDDVLDFLIEQGQIEITEQANVKNSWLYVLKTSGYES